MSFKWLPLGALLLLVWPGCADEETQQDVEAQLRAKRAEIEDMIGVATCSDSADCAFIAFGSKACGGPWTYLIYSRATVDEDLLATRVKEYNALEDRYNRKYGIVSDCSVPPVPRVTCSNGLCVSQQPQATPNSVLQPPAPREGQKQE